MIYHFLLLEYLKCIYCYNCSRSNLFLTIFPLHINWSNSPTNAPVQCFKHRRVTPSPFHSCQNNSIVIALGHLTLGVKCQAVSVNNTFPEMPHRRPCIMSASAKSFSGTSDSDEELRELNNCLNFSTEITSIHVKRRSNGVGERVHQGSWGPCGPTLCSGRPRIP